MTESTAEDQIAERVARNQATYREANDRIDAAAATQSESIPFICECPDTTCTTIIRLEAEEYDRVRADATRFCVAPGHEVCEVQGVDVARLVAREDRFSVMEKIGRAGEVARQLADRRPNERDG